VNNPVAKFEQGVGTDAGCVVLRVNDKTEAWYWRNVCEGHRWYVRLADRTTWGFAGRADASMAVRMYAHARGWTLATSEEETE